MKRQSFAIPRWGRARHVPGKLLLCRVCLVHATGIPERSCLDALASLKTMFKGILHQKIFYRLNLIFWIVMGCGIARFGRRGLKTTET